MARSDFIHNGVQTLLSHHCVCSGSVEERPRDPSHPRIKLQNFEPPEPYQLVVSLGLYVLRLPVANYIGQAG